MAQTVWYQNTKTGLVWEVVAGSPIEARLAKDKVTYQQASAPETGQADASGDGDGSTQGVSGDETATPQAGTENSGQTEPEPTLTDAGDQKGKTATSKSKAGS